MRKLAFASFVISAGAVASIGFPEQADAALGHFLCSTFDVDVSTEPSERHPVGLEDQFGKLETTVRKIAILCAPASKERKDTGKTKKENPDAHLACYDLADKPNVGATVELYNQFETALEGTVDRRRYLCVPSVKEPFTEGDKQFDREEAIEGIEALLNHFVCSDFTNREKDFDRDRLPFDVEDQFGKFVAKIRAPDFICAPAVKTFKGNSKQPKGGLSGLHLACYLFGNDENRTPVEQPPKVFVINQLDEQPQVGTPARRDMFCVPSWKDIP